MPGTATFVVGDCMLLRELRASFQQRGSPAATAADQALCGVHPAVAEREAWKAYPKDGANAETCEDGLRLTRW